MNDLTICKKIAEIEGRELSNKDNMFLPNKDLVYISVIGAEDTTLNQIYNPLTDDTLINPLICKYKVSINWWDYTCTILDDSGNILAEVNFCDMELNKAILLAIIEAHKD
ncbi:MAG: hypothetical protein COA78_21240 [Blastopirellula sp.]|nr:MAG: hypothetical protein COA78_21240 [Blastopirellula sp.]